MSGTQQVATGCKEKSVTKISSPSRRTVVDDNDDDIERVSSWRAEVTLMSSSSHCSFVMLAVVAGESGQKDQIIAN